ncbi:MAG: hypothetical protein Q8S73_36545, partial [Deltaproteobacteria bacterium]|nr:hypothetical protein [Deltaproteobacteria bacterium]
MTPTPPGDATIDIEDIEIEVEAEAEAAPAPAAPELQAPPQRQPPPARASLFGDLALGDDEIDDMFGSVGEGGGDDQAPSLDTAALLEPEIASEVAVVVVGAAAEAPAIEVEEEAEEEEAEVIAVEDEPDDAAVELTAAAAVDDDADDADLTIEADEEIVVVADAPAELDRGAALAAAVTSRRRDDEDLDAAFAVDALAEVRARVDLLVGEAAVAESFVDAAEWYAHAADLLDGALGESARAEQVAERARALAPEVPLGLRVQRRLMLGSGRMAEAARLGAEELAAATTRDEHDTLRWLHAFAAQGDDIDAARGSWRAIAARGAGVESALA